MSNAILVNIEPLNIILNNLKSINDCVNLFPIMYE